MTLQLEAKEPGSSPAPDLGPSGVTPAPKSGLGSMTVARLSLLRDEDAWDSGKQGLTGRIFVFKDTYSCFFIPSPHLVSGENPDWTPMVNRELTSEGIWISIILYQQSSNAGVC